MRTSDRWCRALGFVLVTALGAVGGCAFESESDTDEATGEATEALETYSCTMADGKIAAVLMVTQGVKGEDSRICYGSLLSPIISPAPGLPSCLQRAREAQCMLLLKMPGLLRLPVEPKRPLQLLHRK